MSLLYLPLRAVGESWADGSVEVSWSSLTYGSKDLAPLLNLGAAILAVLAGYLVCTATSQLLRELGEEKTARLGDLAWKFWTLVE